MESKFNSIVSATQDILTSISKLSNYKNYCNEQLSECDKFLSDLDHMLELESINAAKMMKLVKFRKEKLIERRTIKDELERIKCLFDCCNDLTKFTNTIKSINLSFSATQKRLNNRVYSPRIIDGWSADTNNLKSELQQKEKITDKLNKNKKLSYIDYKDRKINIT